MYTDEQIDELFKNKIPQDKESQSYFSAYVNIYKCSFTRPTKSDKYNFHHLKDFLVLKVILKVPLLFHHNLSYL